VAAPSIAPITPNALPLQDALARSAPLALLQIRLRESNARFESLRSVLPPALAQHLRPGPLDAEGWTLLTANNAVAAKLRQFQPRLEAALLDAGWPARTLRIKVQTG
jgi:hypothetical protein